ncbi:serine-rich protein-like protein [Thalictrum thalictroides]|uniref:Serine-rich protein-like protein n=1 Tax=Thalictrum thalictroides TaxID=46969 RepID=A0A7J6WM18_THATH|nr:serine-rich protein-like protein [Thalictrum thalictroides]
MATSSRRSSGPVLHTSKGCQRSISPSGRYSSSYSSSSPYVSSSGFASSSSSFSSSRSTGFFQRSTSPNRVNMYGSVSSSPSIRFSIMDRSISPSRSISAPHREQVVKKQNNHHPLSSAPQKKTCMCSPTNHPGSFRCSFHKNFNNHSASYPTNRLNARRSAMTNSLVRIGTVEGDLVKRALAALIRPSSHSQRRRAGFQPRPSRLSNMSKATQEENL